MELRSARPLRWWLMSPILFALLAWLPSSTYWQETVDGTAFDLLTTLDPPAARGDVVLVAIDGPSMAEIGLAWPWPRSLHAQLIRALHRGGAKVIALDLMFDVSQDPIEDAALADAIRDAGNVVLAAELMHHENEYIDQGSLVGPLQEFIDAGAQAGIASVSFHRVLRQFPSAPDAFARTVLRVAGETVAQDPPADALLRYLGPPGEVFAKRSYYQALEPETLPEGVFKDKIVLVGFDLLTAAELSTDRFLTPYSLTSGLTTAGYEVHATAIENLRSGSAVVPVGRDLLLALLGALILVSAYSTRNFQPLRSTLAVGLMLLLIIAGTLALLRLQLNWLPPPLLLLGVTLPYLTHAIHAVLSERAQRRLIAGAFSRYISPAMVERLQREPQLLRLGGELKEMTILFLDIRGFTTLSEAYKHDPQGLTRIINRFLTPMTAVILREQGTIDKYIGDCIMAFWSAPIDDPDHALHACRAALGMVEALHGFNAVLEAEARAEGRRALRLDIGIGINTGTCVVGNLGSEQQFNYSVLGDAVNLASRLEGSSKNYGVRIVIGEETASAVAGRLTCVELDLIAVKGKAEAVHIYTLLDEGIDADARQGLLAAQGALLAAYRRQDWPAARNALALGRTTGLVPSLFDLYDERIAEYEATPPDAQWSGVYVAQSK